MKTIYISTHNAQNRFLMSDEELKKFYEYLEEEIKQKGYGFIYTTDEIVDDLSTDIVDSLVSYFYYDVLGKTITLQTGIYPDYLMTAEILDEIVKQYDFKTVQDERCALDAINQAVYPETDIAELNKIVQRYVFNIKDEFNIIGFEKKSDEDEEMLSGCKKYKIKFEIFYHDFDEIICLDTRLNKWFIVENEESNLLSDSHNTDLESSLNCLANCVYSYNFYENCINGIKEKLLEWAVKNIQL